MKIPKIPTSTPAAILAERMARLAGERAKLQNLPMSQALRNVAGEMRAAEGVMAQIHERNALLSIKADQDIQSFSKSHIAIIFEAAFLPCLF